MSSSSEGRRVDDFVFERLDQIDKKKIEKQIPHYHEKMIYNELPNDDIIDSGSAIERIKKRTGLNDDQINSGLNNLIENERVISQKGYHTNTTFYRKNIYKPL